MDTLHTTISTALLIGADFESGQDAREPILNPRTGALILDVAEASHTQIDRAVAAARKAFAGWSRTTPAERSAALLRIADRVEAEADAFAALEALNCGKPITRRGMMKVRRLSIATVSLPVPCAARRVPWRGNIWRGIHP
jgi:acyl-CoA reductase-like NAD-dependent aldehyde dehydrogenase